MNWSRVSESQLKKMRHDQINCDAEFRRRAVRCRYRSGKCKEMKHSGCFMLSCSCKCHHDYTEGT